MSNSKIDCKRFSKNTFLQLLKVVPEYCRLIASADDWEEVLSFVNRNFDYTEEQIEFVKKKQWSLVPDKNQSSN